MEKKPYFLPLKSEYYRKIELGEQDCEIRPANYRGWNEKNIYVGRHITVSRGYSTPDRMLMIVDDVFVGSADELEEFAAVPEWHTKAVKEIYGERDVWMAAFLKRGGDE